MKMIIIFIIQAFVLGANYDVIAQTNQINWHYNNNIFIIRRDSLYIVENIGPLKKAALTYDTLIYTNNIREKSWHNINYKLEFKVRSDKLSSTQQVVLTFLKYKEVIKLNPVFKDNIIERDKKLNFLYYNTKSWYRFRDKIIYKNNMKCESSVDIWIKISNEMYKKSQILNQDEFKIYYHDVIDSI